MIYQELHTQDVDKLKRPNQNKQPDKTLGSRCLENSKWKQIQKDMSKAINYWDHVAKRYEGMPNPDEKQLLEIKQLLKDLQKKIKQF